MDASNVIAQLERIVAMAGTVVSAMQAVGKAIVSALQAAADFAVKSASSLPLGEGEGSQGGPALDQLIGGQGLQAGGSDDGSIQLAGVTVEGTGNRAPIGGYPKTPKGPKAKKGPSQDTTDQKEIAEIQEEINSSTEQYHSLIEQNDVAHKLGLTTLQQEDEANLKAGTDYIANIDKAISKLETIKEKVEAVANAHGGENVQEQKQEAQLDKIIAKMQLLKAQTQLANEGDTFWGQWTIGMQKFGDSLILTGAKAQQVFQGIVNQGIDATANALTGLISGTKNWQQAFTQAGESILNTLIKVELQNLAGIALQNSAQATQRLGDARTAAAGVYASASSIPFVGWILAPIAAAAAFAAVLAFAEGGVVEGPPSSTDNRIARVATGEGIVTARAVSHYGPSMIHQMNALTFASGGIVGGLGSAGGGGTASRPVSVHAYFNEGDMRQTILNHPDTQNFILNVVKKGRFQVKV